MKEADFYSFSRYSAIGEKIEFKIAPFILRAQAYLIDLLLFSIVQFIITLVFLQVYLHLTDNVEGRIEFNYLSLSIYLLVSFIMQIIYFFFQERFWDGRTIGKKILNLRVISESGGICSTRSVFLRNVTRVIELGYLPIMGGVWLLLHPQNRRLGDILADSLVIFEEPE